MSEDLCVVLHVHVVCPCSACCSSAKAAGLANPFTHTPPYIRTHRVRARARDCVLEHAPCAFPEVRKAAESAPPTSLLRTHADKAIYPPTHSRALSHSHSARLPMQPLHRSRLWRDQLRVRVQGDGQQEGGHHPPQNIHSGQVHKTVACDKAPWPWSHLVAFKFKTFAHALGLTTYLEEKHR